MNNVIIKARDGSQQVLKSVTGFLLPVKTGKDVFYFWMLFCQMLFWF